MQFLHVNNPGKSFYSVNGITKLLRDKRYDRYLMIGDAHDISTWRMLLLKNLFYRKKRIYFWTHGWYGKESRTERIIKKFFYKLVDGAFLYGNYAKQLMINEGIKEKKLFVIHNSLDYDTQLELRSQIRASRLYEEHFKNTNKNIVFLGRLTKVKKLDMLLEVVSLLRQKGQFFNVSFVGDGVERQHLEDLTEQLGLKDTTWFYGECYDERTNAEFVYNADLCVSPGNVGLTAMHMLMFGTPVITHDDFTMQMPEFEAIVPHKTGMFFKRDDVMSLCDTIQEWFKLNGGLRDHIRKECFKEIDSNWNPDYQIKVLKEHLC